MPWMKPESVSTWYQLCIGKATKKSQGLFGDQILKVMIMLAYPVSAFSKMTASQNFFKSLL